MATSSDICFICEHTLNEGVLVIVKERGMKTIKESSVERNDGKSERFLKGLLSGVVHDSCWKNYTNEKLIAASIHRGSNVPPIPSPSTPCLLYTSCGRVCL